MDRAPYLATTFACDPKFQDRLKGIQLIVGGGCPQCSNRLSCIVGQQELQLGNGMQLTPDMREMAADSSGVAPFAMSKDDAAVLQMTNEMIATEQ